MPDLDALAVRAQAGDETARGQLFELSMEHARRKMPRWFPRHFPLSDDMLQDIAVGVLEAIRDFDPARGSRFTSFLNRCVYNQVVKSLDLERMYAKHAKQLRLDDEFTTETPLDVEIPSLDCLDERERAIVEAHFGLNGHGKYLAAIAKEMGISRERVRQILQAALNKLRVLNLAANDPA